MPSIAVPPDNIAIFRLTPLDSAEAPKFAVGSLTVDDYTTGYVNYNAGGQLVFVTKTIPPLGTIVNVTLTATGTNSHGDALTPFTQVFACAGPTDPDPATHFEITEGPFVRDKIGVTLPPDVGQTIPLQ